MNETDNNKEGMLAGRVILITGAGQGIGRAVAEGCAALGATVVLLGRQVAKLESTYDAIEKAGMPTPAIFPLDLGKAKDNDFGSLADALNSEFGRLDGIVHCAAHLPTLKPLIHEDLDHWLLSLRVNLAAPFALTRACLPLLSKAEDGTVIFTGDSSSMATNPYWGVFGIAKQALAPLVTMWNNELEERANLRFHLLIPGPVHSPQRIRTHPGEAKTDLPPVSDMARAYLRLLGPEGRAHRGQVLYAQDSGWLDNLKA